MPLHCVYFTIAYKEMSNYNLAVKITEAIKNFSDKVYKDYQKVLSTEDLYMISEYSENIILTQLQAKQVFNDDPDAAVGSRFLIPITEGRCISALVAYIEESRDFDIDAVLIYDKVGVPCYWGAKAGWTDEWYKYELKRGYQ